MTEKPSTPVASPKIPKLVKLTEPNTPPSEKKAHRISFLNTPDQRIDHLPYSPSLKRHNDDSPEYKLNSHNIHSPYYNNLLKTPRYTSGYESDENESGVKHKVQKTPTYFSPGKRLFTDDALSMPHLKQKEELSEITSQLKGKLSTAIDKLHKLQRYPKNYKFNFTELNLSTETSPTKQSILRDLSKPTETINRANLNLQNLTNNTSPESHDNPFLQKSPLKNSPSINDKRERIINIPSPSEENSAHNALMATLSRQQEKDKAKRPVSLDSARYKLPPLNLALAKTIDTSSASATISKPNTSPKETEQDAVMSLMSLSSPQSNRFSHSRTQSLNTNTSPGSRSASVVLPSPQNLGTHSRSHSQSLPPISGIINPLLSKKGEGDDETDIEEDVTDEDNDPM